VWLWVNPDDSHICVVFRDGVVLVRTQSGLAPALPGIEGPRAATPYFCNWLLAREVAGRIVPLDLSFGQWLERVREKASKDASQPRIDIVEEDNRIIVDVSRQQAGHPAKATRLYLTWMSPQDPALGAPEFATVDGLCVPAGVRVDGTEIMDAARTWEVMAALADLR
jgi:hypothetical protein